MSEERSLSRVKVLSDQSLARLKRKPKEQLLAKCQKVGLIEAQLSRAVDMVLYHETSLQHIVRWREDGLTLDEIEYCLNIRDNCGFAMSIPLIKWYLDGAGFHAPEPGYEEVESIGFGAIGPEVIVDFFQEVAERVGGTYPHHRIMHFIEENLGGDVMKAYSMGIDKMEDLVGTISPRYAHHLRLSEADKEYIQAIIHMDPEYIWGNNQDGI